MTGDPKRRGRRLPRVSGPRGVHSVIRPLVRQLHAYVPGEQPKIQGLIKLNTNENPYPPSPKVLAAIKDAVDGRLRLYPNPTSQSLREKLAKYHRCEPENIIIGNGSDDLLALAVRAFVEPQAGRVAANTRTVQAGGHRFRDSASTVQYFTPSYSLYPVLAAIHGAATNAVSLSPEFLFPSAALLRKSRAWDFEAALTFITTPNAPTGRGFPTSDLDELCRLHQGLVLLDEAYVDFAEEHALSLSLRHRHVLVARTFSKAYSLCFQRIGYAVGHPDVIAALDKVRDSYNVNGLAQVGALATLDDLPYYRGNFELIKATRARLSEGLAELGFDVVPSATNFILVRPPRFAAPAWLEKLRAQKILVRWFAQPEVNKYLRITIGTDRQANALLAAAKAILKR
ncbi:MAG: histidinol-phosphate aminotransferase [Verrucomicrobiota bacterium]|jgi:histidinol-phosphate aminotransferase